MNHHEVINEASSVKKMKLLNKGSEGTKDEDIIDYSDPFTVPNLLKNLDSGGKYGSVTKGDYSDPFTVPNLLQNLDSGGKYGSVTKDDYSDPFTVPNLLENLDSGKYGSVTKDVQDLVARKMLMLNSLLTFYPNLEKVEEKSSFPTSDRVIVLDSDEEDDAEVVTDHLLDLQVNGEEKSETINEEPVDEEPEKADEIEDEGVDIGVNESVDEDTSDGDDESTADEDGGLSDIWKEMGFALETSKDFDVPVDTDIDTATDDTKQNDEGCDHSFILKDDIGYVCRVCGIIQQAIDTIFDFQYIKASRKRYRSESRADNEIKNSEIHFDSVKVNVNGHDPSTTGIFPHPRHKKQMKPHQLDGFNFLASNLTVENPGGCILAHAPGSGKTFMVISFMHSFLNKYPDARPLVVLPKGILPTWKKEFCRWQVENVPVPLLDFYSSKANNRSQQCRVLQQWVSERSVLFLGYQQFSTIISDNRSCKETSFCRDVLLQCPTIMILDEGHNPRNDNTDMLNALAKVQTLRKVVLSGTLYQNHVKEVFTIFNLVRPRFLKLESSRAIMKRIMSRVSFDGLKKNLRGNAESNFFELVEHTLQSESESESKRKDGLIKDLREMTNGVLHYYKGDFLDDLPGLLDFTVLLKLRPPQTSLVQTLEKMEKASFKKASMGCAVYTHPMLKPFLDRKAGLPSTETIDKVVKTAELRDGVKADFFFNILRLCESTNEKLLVFSQYLLPLKFLERMTVHKKGYRVGTEIFVITGDTSAEERETSMEQFNTSSNSRVFFGSIKACGEGISLVGASRVIILDVHLNPSVSRQALGRAFRPGQEKKVYVYRLVAADSPEQKDHQTCFKKEQIAKRWFEWNEYCGDREFELKKVDPNDTGDSFLETVAIANNIHSLYTRLAGSFHPNIMVQNLDIRNVF